MHCTVSLSLNEQEHPAREPDRRLESREPEAIRTAQMVEASMPNLYVELRDEDDRTGLTPAPLTESEALDLLANAEITASKLIPWGSNYSFAVALQAASGPEHLAIYKPRAGEAPLYDFLDGTLYKREVASYLLSRYLGWDIVPPTVIRDGPHGVGSLQLYIQPVEGPEDPRLFWSACTPEIERMVLFDHIANNADRKLTHCLLDAEGKVWGIDHGLTFNEAPKMRTVLWQFAEDPISPVLKADLAKLISSTDDVSEMLRDLLTPAEIRALFARAERLHEQGRYPRLNPHRNIPYGWW